MERMTAPPATGIGELEVLLARQKSAVIADGPASLALRKDRIQRAIDMLVHYRDAMCDAVREDFGSRPRVATMMFDVASAIGCFKYARGEVAKWMKPQLISTIDRVRIAG